MDRSLSGEERHADSLEDLVSQRVKLLAGPHQGQDVGEACHGDTSH